MANKKGKIEVREEPGNRECVCIIKHKICVRGEHEKERDGYSEIEIALNITQKN